MTKRTTGPGFPKLKPKKYPSPHKDVPVLTKKMPDRPRKSTRGSKYRPASLATFHTGERIIANAENKTKRGGGDKKRTGLGRFFGRLRFAGGGGSDSPGYAQPTGSKSLKGKRIPKLQ